MSDELNKDLLKKLWWFLTGKWTEESRLTPAEQDAMITDMPMPLCGDKYRHFHQEADAGYCVGCRAAAYIQRKREEQERLATRGGRGQNAGKADRGCARNG